MSEPRLHDALRRLRDRAANAAFAEEVKGENHGDLHALLRPALAQEILDSDAIRAIQARLSAVEHKVDELVQIIGSLENESFAADPLSDPNATSTSVDQRSSGPARSSYSSGVEPRLPERRWGRGIMLALAAATVIAIGGLTVAAAGHMPTGVTMLLDQITERFGSFIASVRQIATAEP